VLLLSLSALIVWRCYDFFIAPELRAEDGAKVFAYFYTHREFAALFRFKAGYVPFLPNLIGYMAVRVPATATPYFLTIVPTFLTLTTFSVLRASAYRRYIGSDALRFVLCLVLALAPIGNHLTVCHTDYSIWNALLLLLLLVILPMPRGIAMAALFSLALATLIWSHPLTILALPASLVWLWRERRVVQRTLHGLIVACQIAHVWFGNRLETAVIAKDTRPVWNRLSELSLRVLDHLCGGIIRPTVSAWGPGTAEFNYVLSALFVVALLACAVLPKQRIASRAFYAWIGYGIAAPMMLIAFARAERGLQATRYYYISKAFTTIAVCLLISQVLFSLTRRWAPRFNVLPAVAFVLLLAYLNEHKGGLVQPDPANARIVAKFFSDLAEAELEHGGHCGIHLDCRKRRGDWPFTIDTRENCK